MPSNLLCTGVQLLNGQPAVWQQVGAWPQGTNLLSPTGLIPQPLGQNWPVPIAALPITGAGISSVNSNQGLVMKELEDLKQKFEIEKKRTRDIFTKNSKETVSLKEKMKVLEVKNIGVEDKLVKEREKTKSLEKKVKELQGEADELKKEKKLRKLAEEKVAILEKAARAGKEEKKKFSQEEKEKLSKEEKERKLRKARASAKREETLQRIEAQKNFKEKDEEWFEDYVDCSGRGVGVVAVKRRKSTGGQASSVNANEVGNLGNGKPGRERWVLDSSNANKKVKVGEGVVNGESSNEKAVAGSSDASASKVHFKIIIVSKVSSVCGEFNLNFRSLILRVLILANLMGEEPRRKSLMASRD